jgi:hypothetical protein
VLSENVDELAHKSHIACYIFIQGRLSSSDNLTKALERGITKCLKQLQNGCSKMLPSPKMLKDLEWTTCYIPTVASSLMSIIRRSSSLNYETLPMIDTWRDSMSTSQTENEMSQSIEHDDRDTLESILARKLQQVVLGDKKDNKQPARTTQNDEKAKKHKSAKKPRSSPTTVKEIDDYVDFDFGGDAKDASVASLPEDRASRAKAVKYEEEELYQDLM